jgi:hypothetical protein
VAADGVRVAGAERVVDEAGEIGVSRTCRSVSDGWALAIGYGLRLIRCQALDP